MGGGGGVWRSARRGVCGQVGRAVARGVELEEDEHDVAGLEAAREQQLLHLEHHVDRLLLRPNLVRVRVSVRVRLRLGSGLGSGSGVWLL